METNLLDWLNEKNLLTVIKNHNKPFRKVLTKLFDLRKDQEILVITDDGSHGKRVAAIMAGCYYYSAEKLGYKPYVVMQTAKTIKEPAKKVIDALMGLKNGGLVILSLSNKLGSLSPAIGKSFRRFTLDKKHNFISTTGLGSLENKDIYLITRALDLDYGGLERTGRKIKKILDIGRKIRIKTDAGTDFSASIMGMKSISLDGNYRNDKRGGNVPVGEVYLPPVTGSLNGVIVIDGSLRYLGGTLIVETPVRLEISKSQIVKITGGYEARLLENTLKNARKQAKNSGNVMKIGEIGIGINPNIDIVGSMVLDEKARNTAHVAIGSNYWFGGDIRTFLHLDQVMRNPSIFVDGKKLEY